MGLDQYGWKILTRVGANDLMEADGSRLNHQRQVTFPWWPKKDRVDIAYWRKCWPIQNYMTSLYVSRAGCNEEDFNCVDLELSAQDLVNLASYFKVRAGQGFRHEKVRALVESEDESFCEFISERDYEALCEFIQDAHAAIDAGMKVVYSCWW